MPSDQEQFEIPVKDAISGSIKSVTLSLPVRQAGLTKGDASRPQTSAPPPASRPQSKPTLRPTPSPTTKSALPEIVPEERVAVVRAPPRPSPKPVMRPTPPPTPRPAPKPALRPVLSAPIVEEKPLPAHPEDQARRTQTNDVYATMAEDILRSSNVQIPNELVGRLQTIIVSRLKDVRDPIETAEILVRPINQAGMGFSSVDAKKVLDRADTQFKALQTELTRTAKENTAAAIKTETERSEERKRRAEATEEQSREALFESVTQGKARPITVENPKSKIPISNTVKPRVQDVARASSLVGPVEELAALTLADWRKLSQNPKEAALKVRDIIKLLGDQSLERRTAGVQGWRQSEPMRLYEGLIGESFKTKKPVSSVIDARASTKQPTLTWEEFNAIMELNALLRS